MLALHVLTPLTLRVFIACSFGDSALLMCSFLSCWCAHCQGVFSSSARFPTHMPQALFMNSNLIYSSHDSRVLVFTSFLFTNHVPMCSNRAYSSSARSCRARSSRARTSCIHSSYSCSTAHVLTLYVLTLAFCVVTPRVATSQSSCAHSSHAPLFTANAVPPQVLTPHAPQVLLIGSSLVYSPCVFAFCVLNLHIITPYF